MMKAKLLKLGMVVKIGDVALAGVGLCALLAMILNAVLPDKD